MRFRKIFTQKLIINVQKVGNNVQKDRFCNTEQQTATLLNLYKLTNPFT